MLWNRAGKPERCSPIYDLGQGLMHLFTGTLDHYHPCAFILLLPEDSFDHQL